jgi:hypothetical protein
VSSTLTPRTMGYYPNLAEEMRSDRIQSRFEVRIRGSPPSSGLLPQRQREPSQKWSQSQFESEGGYQVQHRKPIGQAAGCKPAVVSSTLTRCSMRRSKPSDGLPAAVPKTVSPQRACGFEPHLLRHI